MGSRARGPQRAGKRDGERLLYSLLKELKCSYISVAHRVPLYEHHDTMLELLGDGKWKLKPVESGAEAKSDGDPEHGKAEALRWFKLSSGEGMAD